MNTTFKIAAAAAFAGSMALAAPASALTINGTCGSLSGPTELNGSFNCTQFDSTLGTLNSMVLTITGGITGSIELTNRGTQTENVSASTNSSFFAGALAGFSLSSPLFTASFGTGLQAIASGATVNFPGLAGGGTTGGLLNNSNLAPYQAAGGGNFAINISTLSGLNLQGGGGNIDSSQITAAQVTATVVYDYGTPPTETPEPATMALLGAGLLGLGFARRRRS